MFYIVRVKFRLSSPLMRETIEYASGEDGETQEKVPKLWNNSHT